MTDKNTKLLLGLGISNRAVANYFDQHNIKYVIFDENTLDHPAAIQKINNESLKQVDTVIASPGFDPSGPMIQQCLQAGCQIINDIELFAQLTKKPIIAVTGTNGKSTTATLIQHMLEACEKKSLLGGNIGIAAMSLLDKPTPDFYVLEVSSFQIELAPSLKPFIGICTNITPDHIERHGSFENYAAIKKSLLASSHIQIVGNEHLFHNDQERLDKINALCPQYHFKLNVLTALAAINAIDADLDQAILSLNTFKNLAHRTEVIATNDGIVWVDDSKGTNVGATIAAVESFYQANQKLILLKLFN